MKFLEKSWFIRGLILLIFMGCDFSQSPAAAPGQRSNFGENPGEIQMGIYLNSGQTSQSQALELDKQNFSLKRWENGVLVDEVRGRWQLMDDNIWLDETSWKIKFQSKTQFSTYSKGTWLQWNYCIFCIQNPKP